jgi:hypothetical protein
MTSGAQTRDVRFIEVSWGIHGLRLSFWVFLELRWMMTRMILGEVALLAYGP